VELLSVFAQHWEAMIIQSWNPDLPSCVNLKSRIAENSYPPAVKIGVGPLLLVLAPNHAWVSMYPTVVRSMIEWTNH
jgi:hypothetical protein